MKHYTGFLLGLLALIMLLVSTWASTPVVSAAPPAQVLTATPGPDGRILYTVASGDTCLSIALIHGIDVPRLRQLNTRLDENCTLSIGQQLVVGLAAPEEPTAGALPTLPSPTVTATPVSGTTEVCVLLFNDQNGDALRQETELGVDGGAVSLTNLNGSYSQTQNTSSAIDLDTAEPVRACFTNVPQGEYNVSMAVPDTYNPTMLLSYNLTVNAGDRASVDFGAQLKSASAADPAVPDEGGSRSSLLGVFGLLLLLGGAGLGYYAYRAGQPKSKLKNSPLSKR